MRPRLAAAVLALAPAVFAPAGCACTGHAAAAESSGASGASRAAISGTVTVFAAASLRQTFTSLATAFEHEHPGVTVEFSFGGSDTLAAQITEGAPADVFASADTATMRTVQQAGDAPGTPTVFVRNTLEIATAPGNPKNIKTLADLTKPGIAVALCAKTVPCGSAAVKALAAANLALTPVTYETNVTSALTKVELGEVDAALVYHSDILGADGKVDGIVFSTASDAVNSYPIDVLKDAPNPSVAAAFVAFVLSPSSRQTLLAAGFQAP